MIHYLESKISANHNYLVNGIMTPGFVSGNPNDSEDFYFLADVVLPGESTPRISARIFDDHGLLLAEIHWNRIRRNPENCSHESAQGGFKVVAPTGNPLLEVKTQQFANGYLTCIVASIFDQKGRLRVKPGEGSIRIEQGNTTMLEAPFQFEAQE